MRDKYANKTPLMRFFHKYTGFIFCAIVLSIAIPWWVDYDSNLEFYDRWGCEQIKAYIYTGESFCQTPHDELSNTQHLGLHEIINECMIVDNPDSIFKHDMNSIT